MGMYNMFREENIGMPVKYERFEGSKKVTYYGRYYGLGFNGESKPEHKDAEYVCFVTPDSRWCSLYPAFLNYDLTINELTKLYELESEQEKPYELFFYKKDDKYVKNYAYQKEPLTLSHYPASWYEDHGLFKVGTDVLGRALAKLFTKVYGEEYHYQRLRAESEDSNPAWCGRARDSRCMRIISTKKYEDRIYDKTIYHGYYRQPCYNDHGILQPELDIDSLFRHAPVKMKDGEYLLYFDYHWDPEKITIGAMTDTTGQKWEDRIYDENAVFTAYKSFTESCKEKGEVYYDNTRFTVVPSFLERVIDYKLKHYKLELEEKDMDAIIKDFMIEFNKSAKTQKIVLTNPEVEK